MGFIVGKTGQDFEPYMAPDEHAEDFLALLEALTQQLGPQGYLERRQVELVAHCDWEISRHRRQSTQLLKAEVRRVERQILFSPRTGDPKLSGSELAARAYCTNSDHHAHHEEATAHLERRRSQLLKEFRDLRELRRLQGVEEAEVVET